MIKLIFKFTLALLLILVFKCDEPTKPKSKFNTITFTNRTWKDITIVDNSGQNVFEDILVLGYSTKRLTYECPSTGCDVDWYYSYEARYGDVAICSEGYVYNKSYTFGFCPDNLEWAEPNERCVSCQNSACDGK